MNAYEVMNEWDRTAGNEQRSNAQLDKDVPAIIQGYAYDDWKARIEAGDVRAIIKGLRAWGLPVGPLAPFEVEENIPTAERHY